MTPEVAALVGELRAAMAPRPKAVVYVRGLDLAALLDAVEAGEQAREELRQALLRWAVECAAEDRRAATEAALSIRGLDPDYDATDPKDAELARLTEELRQAEAALAGVREALRELAEGCLIADALLESTLGMTVHEGDVTVSGGEDSPIYDAALRKWAVKAIPLIQQLPWTVAGYPRLREKIAAALASSEPKA